METRTKSDSSLTSCPLTILCQNDDMISFFSDVDPSNKLFGQKIYLSEEAFNRRQELIDLRNIFHSNAELSWKEFSTTTYIDTYLNKLNQKYKLNPPLTIQSRAQYGETGLMCKLQGSKDEDGNDGISKGKCIGIRADIDALPIDESDSKFEHKSKNANVSHMCGHDAHIAVGLVTVKLLCKYQNFINKNDSIVFIFQCAEETGGGAYSMINDKNFKSINIKKDNAKDTVTENKEDAKNSNSNGNVVTTDDSNNSSDKNENKNENKNDNKNKNDSDNTDSDIKQNEIKNKNKNLNLFDTIDEIYGLHVGSRDRFGEISLNCEPESMMSGACNFVIKITGAGGHGALPHIANDPMIAGCSLVLQAQTILSRNINPNFFGVLTFGTFNCGNKGNVISNEAILEGTMRWFKPEVGKLLKSRLIDICKGIEVTYNVKVEFNTPYRDYPCLVNNKDCHSNVVNAAKRIFNIKDDDDDDNESGSGNGSGSDLLNANCEKNGASEDFSEYLLRKPGAFFFLGSRFTDPNDVTKKHFHHSKNFAINCKSLVVGVQMFLNIVFDVLGK